MAKKLVCDICEEPISFPYDSYFVLYKPVKNPLSLMRKRIDICYYCMNEIRRASKDNKGIKENELKERNDIHG